MKSFLVALLLLSLALLCKHRQALRHRRALTRETTYIFPLKDRVVRLLHYPQLFRLRRGRPSRN